MSDLQRKNTTIESFEQKLAGGSKKYTIKDVDGDKYEFWETKKDGTLTKAYQSFAESGFGGNGNPIQIVFNASQESFTNPEGKLINFTRRSVAWFEGATEHTHAATGQPVQQVPNTQTPTLEQRVAVLETKVAMLMGKKEASIEKVAQDFGGKVVSQTPVSSPMQPGDDGYVNVQDINF